MVVGGGGILEDVGGICCIFSFIFEVGGGGDVISCVCWLCINVDCLFFTRVSIADALFVAIRCFWCGVSGASVEGGVVFCRVEGTSVEGGYEAGMVVVSLFSASTAVAP